MAENKKATPEGATKEQNYSITEERILARLREGPASRKELAEITGLDDRTLRRYITKLQTYDQGDGRLIVNHQDQGGYKIAGSKSELRSYKMQELSRAKKTLAKLNNMVWQEDRQIQI